jgi:hypothetical protein
MSNDCTPSTCKSAYMALMFKAGFMESKEPLDKINSIKEPTGYCPICEENERIKGEMWRDFFNRTESRRAEGCR